MTQLLSPARTLELMGNTLTFHATHADTGEAWSLVEYTCPPHFPGPPLHIHDHFTEAFYVIRGALTVTVEGERHHSPAGTFIRVPPGMAHTFSNEQDTAAQFLIFCAPGGFEQYFLDLAQLAQTAPSWPPEDPAVLMDLTSRYDLRNVTS